MKSHRITSQAVVLVVVLAGGCASPRAYLGMSQQEFVASVNATGFLGNSVTVERLTDHEAVYREDLGTSGAMFYYFVDGRLARMDRGVPQQQRVQYEIVQRE